MSCLHDPIGFSLSKVSERLEWCSRCGAVRTNIDGVENIWREPTEPYHQGIEAAAKHIENHSCVATCCDAQPSGEEPKQLAECVRRLKGSPLMSEPGVVRAMLDAERLSKKEDEECTCETSNGALCPRCHGYAR